MHFAKIATSQKSFQIPSNTKYNTFLNNEVSDKALQFSEGKHEEAGSDSDWECLAVYTQKRNTGYTIIKKNGNKKQQIV